MIPSSSNFPNSFDNDTNLFLVHDSLRVRLLEDYNPGDSSILVDGSEEMMQKFPPTGIITLTEQCNEIDKRALSFFYNSKTTNSFDELELLPEFSDLDVVKPKKITNVTINVIDKHHNHLKDSLLSIQRFLGTKYSNSENDLSGRIKKLKNLVLSPKAWFSVSSSIGLAPFFVEFKNESLRIDDKFTLTWDFGDGETLRIEYENYQDYISRKEVVNGIEIDGPYFKKQYVLPKLYSVSLIVENSYGTDFVEFNDLINAKNEAPENAIINISPKSSQKYSEGDVQNGVFPKIRSVVNEFINLEIPSGPNPYNSAYSSGGELYDGSGKPIDEIIEYTWSLGDDVPHENSRETKASYSLGGIYDIKIRVDTEYGSYRITNYQDSIDIIENSNLWLFSFSKELEEEDNSSGIVQAYEFGMNSETFKTLGNQTLSINRNSSFLNAYKNGYYSQTFEKAIKEFQRNVEFAPSGTISSGEKGLSMLFWASGGDLQDENKINIANYNAFDDVYQSVNSIENRPWNWASLVSQDNVYFLFGSSSFTNANSNNSYPKRLDYSLSSQQEIQSIDLDSSSFENGANELLNHPSYFDEDGLATNGYFASYRTTWKDYSGYMLRNSSVNEFFRLSNFYKTTGTNSNIYSSITKLPDVVGSSKLEGELVSLYNGIFLFNNSGEICAWNDVSLTWEVGRANSSSLSFRSIQDRNKSNFDDKSNTLLATSDQDRIAYLSYDYSENAFIKFNGTDLTFSLIKSRPSGTQFKMGVY